jgi:hypothetical protein
MTSTPPAAPETNKVIAPPGVPLDESLRALEDTRRLLDEAISALDSGDDEQLARAYDRAAECADHVARALWFLRRVAREQGGAGAPAAVPAAPAAAAPMGTA